MTGWIILGVIVLIIGYLFMAYNGLVSMRQRANQAFADIDVQLKQRHDLIPNLIETVKGYASHERETLDAVIKARNSAMSAAPQSAAQAQSEGMLGAALGRLFALSEAYPDLKANTNFLKLQEDLGDVENKLSAAGASSTTLSGNTTPPSSRSRPCSSQRAWASCRAPSSILATTSARRWMSRPR